MGLDARELEKMVESFIYGRLSRIQELNEFGKILYEIIKEKVPYLTECIENSKMNSDNQFESLNSGV